MKSLEILVIATALAMDAFAVSITCGLSQTNTNNKNALKVGLFFGIFQTLMSIIGYYIWHFLPFDISLFDHWVAFGLLTFIGIHMIKESYQECDDKTEKKNLFKTKYLTIAAIATSIDALAAGFSLSILNAGILLLSISTGIITFTLSIIGIKIGKKFGHILEKRVEFISGLILIIIGLKILFDHMNN